MTRYEKQTQNTSLQPTRNTTHIPERRKLQLALLGVADHKAEHLARAAAVPAVKGPQRSLGRDTAANGPAVVVGVELGDGDGASGRLVARGGARVAILGRGLAVGAGAPAAPGPCRFFIFLCI